MRRELGVSGEEELARRNGDAKGVEERSNCVIIRYILKTVVYGR